MNGQPHLSVTQLKMYLRCPLQYFFRYNCGIKVPASGDMLLGRTFHDTLKDNYRQKVQSHQDMPLEQIRAVFSDHWEKEMQYALFSKDENPGQLKDQGISILETYQKDVAPEIQPVEVEREFLIGTGSTKLPLKGYIDLIDDQGYIIDHKTTKRSFPQDAAKKDIQLTAYALAYRTLYGHKEAGVRLDAIRREVPV